MALIDIIRYYFHKEDFKTISIDLLQDLIFGPNHEEALPILNEALSDLSKIYKQMKVDPQYSPNLVEVNKYNSKYLVATQSIKNFEAFLEFVE